MSAQFLHDYLMMLAGANVLLSVGGFRNRDLASGIGSGCLAVFLWWVA